MKTKNILIGLGIFIFIVISVLYTGLFSAISTSTFTNDRASFLQDDIGCGRTTTYQFDDIRIVYETQEISSRTLDPESDDKHDCVPKEVQIYDTNILVYHYDTDSGLILDNTGDKHNIVVDNDRTLDDDSVYILPDNLISRIDMDFYPNAFYDTNIRNGGHNSIGSTTGSTLRFYIYFKRENITTEILSDSTDIALNNKFDFKVTSNFPMNVDYSDICVDLGVEGFFTVQYDTFCLGQSEILAPGETKTFSINIPSDNNVLEYQVRANLKDVYMLPSFVTTNSVRSIDIDRYLVAGNRVYMGDLIGAWQNVSLIELVQKELNELEGDLQSQLDYISSLEISEEEKLSYIDNLELSQTEMIEYIGTLELDQQEKDDIINQIKAEATEQEELLLDLQKQNESMRYIIIGIFIVLAIILIIYIMKRKR